MSSDKKGGFETPQTSSEDMFIERVRKAMPDATAKITSKEDAERMIWEVLVPEAMAKATSHEDAERRIWKILDTFSPSVENNFIEQTRKTMYDAMAKATSEKDAEQKIKEALKDLIFLGPLIIYMELGEGKEKHRHIVAMIRTISGTTIEAEFVGELIT